MDSFVKRWPGLQAPAQLGHLLRPQGPGWKLLDGAESDAVGFAEGAVDSTGFGHPHLSVVEDQGRDVAGVGVAVADEPTAFG